jgi:uncharacterized protein YuzE
MKELVKSSKLKSEYWQKMQQNREKANHVCYDKELDTLILSVESPKDRIITHYIDSCVALLYRHSDKELVGIRIESFSKRFTPYLKQHKTWKLSEKEVYIEGIEDMVFGIRVRRSETPKETIHLERGVDLVPEFARPQ